MGGGQCPGGTRGKEPTCQAGDVRHTGSTLGQEDPLGKEMQLTPVFLPGKSHGQRSLQGYSPLGSQEIGIQLSD